MPDVQHRGFHLCEQEAIAVLLGRNSGSRQPDIYLPLVKRKQRSTVGVELFRRAREMGRACLPDFVSL
jgi:hypothetical protein